MLFNYKLLYLNCFSIVVTASYVKSLDTVYEKIMERVGTDKTRNEEIARRSVNILKSNLPSYVPTGDVLWKLDTFCQSIMTDNDQIIKVRALLLILLPSGFLFILSFPRVCSFLLALSLLLSLLVAL